MKTVTIVSLKRSGLFAEHSGIAPVVHEARATIPAVEALKYAGATIVPLPSQQIGYKITLGEKMSKGIVAVHLNESPCLGLRIESEPEFPIEFSDYWNQVDFTPCPVCGAPTVWYEAVYVAGYRVCTRPPYHHCRKNNSRPCGRVG